MDPYSTNPATQPQTPPGTDDPNVTRYIPPHEVPVTETPRPEVPRAETPAATYEQPPASTTLPSYQYSQYQYGGNGQAQQSTRPRFGLPVDKRDRDRTILALILIGGGALFLLDQFSFFPGFGDMILLLIGGIFMYAYFTTKPGYRIGFLIPGAILSGIGVGQFLSSFPGINTLFGSGITAVTLGLGFCMIWFFERRHWWFLIPGGIILLGGLSSMWRISALWPVVLIALGVYLLYDQSRRHPR
jgi:hypothetical protein